MKTYFVTLDVYNQKDDSIITFEDVNTISKLDGHYSVEINGAKISFEYPILLIEEEVSEDELKIIWR